MVLDIIIEFYYLPEEKFNKILANIFKISNETNIYEIGIDYTRRIVYITTDEHNICFILAKIRNSLNRYIKNIETSKEVSCDNNIKFE